MSASRASTRRSGPVAAASSSATNRPRIALPVDGASALAGGVVGLVLDGTTSHADVWVDDAPVIPGAYDNARLGRSPAEGENRMPGWVDGVGLSIGRSVLLDEIVPGFLYGGRPPGETAVYEAVEPSKSSLSNIAEGLDGSATSRRSSRAGRPSPSPSYSTTPWSMTPRLSRATLTPSGAAGDHDGRVERDLSAGDCPDAEADPGGYEARLVFAFAEAQNESVGELYAEGPVIHAYVQCACGTRYEDKWVAQD